MSIHVKRGGTWTEITSELWRKSPSVAWERIVSVWVRRSAVWQKVYQPIPTDMIIFHNGTPGTGFNKADGSADALNLNGYHLRGSNGANGDVGANTHTDTAAAASTTAGGSGTQYTASGTTGLTQSHTHSIASHSHSSQNHEPPYVLVVPYVVASVGLLPIGTILYYRGSSAPTGFGACDGGSGRLSAGDKYLKCTTGTPGTTGGNATHNHGTWSGDTNGGDLGTMQGAVGIQGTHVHSASHGMNNSNNDPVHVELMAVQATAAIYTIPAGIVAFFKGSAAPTGWTICSSSPNYQDALIKCKTGSYSDTKTGSDTHTDTSPATATGSNGAYNSDNFYEESPSGYTASYLSHTHTINAHNHGTTNQSIPLSKKLLICVKS